MRSWPGGRHIADRWRDVPLSVILLNPGGDPTWGIRAILDTFPSTECTLAAGFRVLVAPEFPAHVCEFFVDEYGPSAETRSLAQFGACAAGLDHAELTAVLARGIDHAVEFSGELYAHDGRIDYLVDVAPAANKANAPLSLAVELAPTRWNFDIEEYSQVLAAAVR